MLDELGRTSWRRGIIEKFGLKEQIIFNHVRIKLSQHMISVLSIGAISSSTLLRYYALIYP